MLTILKKELKVSFRSARTYIFLSLCLFFSGLLITAYNLYYGSAKIEYAISDLMLVTALVLPLISTELFIKDRQDKTELLLYSLPFKTNEIFFAKYTSILCLFGIDVAFLAIMPIFLNIFGSINFATAYSSILCFALFGAALLALLTFISINSKTRLKSYLISYASVIGAFLLSLIPSSSSISVLGVLRALSPFAQFDSFILGGFDLGAIIYYLIFCALFIFLAALSANNRRAKVENGGRI